MAVAAVRGGRHVECRVERRMGRRGDCSGDGSGERRVGRRGVHLGEGRVECRGECPIGAPS